MKRFELSDEAITDTLCAADSGACRYPAELEHVLKKLPDFFDKDLLQYIAMERFIFDRTIPSDRKAR
jgi:hypothetical protein